MTINKNIAISGSGGKDDGGFSEAPNDLLSVQYAQIIDLLCEGEIGGLLDGEKSIFIDKTPLQNADDSYNFKNVTTDWRNGTQSQSVIPGNDSVQSEIGVGVQILQATPVVRQITDVELDSVNITISTPRMTEQNTENGDLKGTQVLYTIELQSNGGGYVFIDAEVQATGIEDIIPIPDEPPFTEMVTYPVEYFSITGKTLTEYKTSTNVILTGSAPWDIRVTRITDDAGSAALNNDIYFSSYTKIIDTKLSYPNSALVGIRIDAKQFRQVPSRGYEVKLLKVKIPSNYNPLTRNYTGTWDGTFTVAWSNNPAWCFYDIIINDRYGLGSFIDQSLTDKWALYEIAQYCDGVDGSGNFVGVLSGFLDEVSDPIYEPRFTCNLYLQKRKEAYKVIRDMASIFRAILFWSSDVISVVQDKPEEVTYQFTNASVIDGSFGYQGTPARLRHTVAIITWNDPEDAYRQKLEYVEDTTGIARFGVNELQTVAMGCTSRGQAHRFGKWILFSENNETEVVTFQTGLEGANVKPGMIIRTIDSDKAGARYGGRLVSVTGTTITLDNEITLETAITYTISFVLPDGSIIDKNITTAAPAETSTIEIDSVFSVEPIEYSVWVVSSVNLSPEEWRVLDITEEDPTKYTITALEYNSSKYDFIENDLALEIKQSTILTTDIAPVTGLVFEESLYDIGHGNFGTRINLSWDTNLDAVSYMVRWRRDSDNYNFVTVRTNNAELSGVGFGIFDFEVTAYNFLGTQSVADTLLGQVILGVTAPPQDVPSFEVYQNGTSLVLKWGKVTDFDLDGYEIRYLEFTGSGLWEDAIPLTEIAKGTNITTVDVPDGHWEFMISAIDTTGNYSTNHTSKVILFSSVFDIISSVSFAPDFAGTLTNMIFHHTGKLVPDSQDLASVGDWDTFDITVPNPFDDCYYEMAEYDNGFDDISRVSGSIESALVPINPTGTADPHFDIDYKLEAGAYDGFEKWGVGNVEFRYLKARAHIDTTSGVSIISEVTRIVDAVEFTQKAESVSIGSGGTIIEFPQPFHLIPYMTVLVVSGTALLVTITAKSSTQVTINLFDTTGTQQAGTVDWAAIGV